MTETITSTFSDRERHAAAPIPDEKEGTSASKARGKASSRKSPDLCDVMRSYDPTTNLTSPILTRYERAKLIGLRTEQISRGAKPLSQGDDSSYEGLSPSEIAIEELRQKKSPIIVVRLLPDGRREYWRVQDMAVLFQT